MTLFIVLMAMAPQIGCSPSVPTDFQNGEKAPSIWPDYSDVTVPPNIAPLNFEIREEGEDFVTVLSDSDGEKRVCVSGKTVQFPEKIWRAALEASQKGEISFEIYAKKGRVWTKFAPILNRVSDDRIDPWVSYRLIEPGFDLYGQISLNQRNVERFDERTLINTAAVTPQTCVNCHHYQNRSGDRFLFHARGDHGGTTLVIDGKIRRVNTKLTESDDAAVYPAWHPTLPLIAFSSNRTRQAFHSTSPNRIEVYDQFSDMLLYDIEKNELRPVAKTREIFETFPSWSPDGKTLYYCAATLPPEAVTRVEDKENSDFVNSGQYAIFKYNIVRMPFDTTARTFGSPETVIDAAALDKSAVHPRISPNGRFLLYTISNYGTFPIWHRDSDLKMLDLTTGKEVSTDAICSPESESWHTWDSSGRWIVFSSRRGDSLYTRLFFAHVSEDGVLGKPFLLPQKSPEMDTFRLKSYNIPEMMTTPVSVSPARLARSVRFQTPENVKAADK